MITKREARALIRKAVKRVPEGEEIRHLNIMPMMDMMTILLVAMIFQASQASALTAGDVDLPESISMEPPPEGAVTLTIANEAILIEGESIVAVKNGAVDPSEKKGGTLGIEITRISQFLGVIRQDREARDKAEGKKSDEVPELLILGDKTIPYQLLFEVIASSRTDEAGYKRFRLIVLDGGSAPME